MKKQLKALLCVTVIAVMLLSLFACKKIEKNGDTNGVPIQPAKVITLKGPTGMGMAQLMNDSYSEYYNITLAGAPDEVSTKFISGEVDIAAVPVNLAAMLYNKTEGAARLLAVNTLGVLYVLENGNTINSLADLAGKTVYATGQGSTPEYVLSYLLAQSGLTDSVTVEYKTEHSELATLMASGGVTIGMLPEPNVSAVTSQNSDVRVALDLTAEWERLTGTSLVQGCIIVRDTYYENNKEHVERFCADYEAAVNYVNDNIDEASQLIAKLGIVASAPVAKKAIPNCNIVYIAGAEAKSAMTSTLQTLLNANPKSIGGAMPDDAFYISISG